MFERHSRLLGECMTKIFQAKVLVAGVGGLGCTVASLLVRLGVGQIHLLDRAIVDEPDLNRQILYSSLDIGQKKVEVAQRKLTEVNPRSRVIPICVDLDESFDLPSVDVVVDCLDNFESKFVLDALCEEKGVPLVHAGVEGYCGQVTTILPGSMRLRKLFGTVNREEPQRQVYPPLVTLVASLQVNEAIKLICRDRPLLVDKLMLIDLSSGRFETIEIRSGGR